MDDSVIEFRYSERNGRWVAQQHSVETSDIPYPELGVLAGELGSQPPWLRRILDVAEVGGHIKKLKRNPPSAIFWFRVDKDLNLTEITNA
jgi:hypothetical protein